MVTGFIRSPSMIFYGHYQNLRTPYLSWLSIGAISSSVFWRNFAYSSLATNARFIFASRSVVVVKVDGNMPGKSLSATGNSNSINGTMMKTEKGTSLRTIKLKILKWLKLLWSLKTKMSEHWIVHSQNKKAIYRSNLCTMTTLGPQNRGRYKQVVDVQRSFVFQNKTQKWRSLLAGSR